MRRGGGEEEGRWWEEDRSIDRWHLHPSYCCHVGKRAKTVDKLGWMRKVGSEIGSLHYAEAPVCARIAAQPAIRPGSS